MANSAPRSFKVRCSDGSALIERLDELHWGRLAEDSRARKANRFAASIVGNGNAPGADVYRRWATSMFFAVSMLERQLKHNKYNKMLAPLFVSEAVELGRSAHLQEDVSFYLGDDFVQKVKMSPATAQYINTIQLACHSQPEMLLAHAYVVYIGFLSVAKPARSTISNMASRSDGSGAKLFQFDIDNLPKFVDRWRHQVDGLHISPQHADALVQEASKVLGCMSDILCEAEEPQLLSPSHGSASTGGLRKRVGAPNLGPVPSAPPPAVPGHAGIDFANAKASDCPFLNPQSRDVDRAMTAQEKLIAVFIWFFIFAGSAVFIIETVRSFTNPRPDLDGDI